MRGEPRKAILAALPLLALFLSSPVAGTETADYEILPDGEGGRRFFHLGRAFIILIPAP